MTEQELRWLIHRLRGRGYVGSLTIVGDELERLLAEVQRLQGLIKQAEWAGYDGTDCCPWCQGDAPYMLALDGTPAGGVHKPTCPAFGEGK